MSVGVAFYMDVHVPGPVSRELRSRGVDVLTAQNDGADEALDPDILDRASKLGRVVVTQDDDFLAEAHRRQTEGIPFGGVIYGHQLRVTIGRMVLDLELIAKACDQEDFVNHVEYLPL